MLPHEYNKEHFSYHFLWNYGILKIMHPKDFPEWNKSQKGPFN